MDLPADAGAGAEAVTDVLFPTGSAYVPTPLLDLPRLAARLRVAQVLVKDEGRRALGSFKSLGGTYAGLRALARATGADVRAVAAGEVRALPALVCASDGNHGLAVAEAARRARTQARVYLHDGVPQARAARIADRGAEIVWIDGTYDAAVLAAAAAAGEGGAVLVADTGHDPDDPVVRDVMTGYGVVANEIRDQLEATGHPRPSHVFVQAGVGGLAAALAEGLGEGLAEPGVVVVVEPEAARCVGPALEAGHPVQIGGDLATAAEMLACGRASAPALGILLGRHARSIGVDERTLLAAPGLLRDAGGPLGSPSGAAGLAGAMAALADPSSSERLAIGGGSRLLIVCTESNLAGPTPGHARRGSGVV